MSKKVLNLVASFDVKEKAESDNEDLIISGYANTTDKDRAGDVVLEDAWKKGGLDNYLQNPIILGFHKHDNPIGVMVDHFVNSKGLHISAKISKAAGKIYNLIKEGVLRSFSISFMVKDADYDSATDIFVIKDLELLEVSVVSVPANQYSIFSVRKSFDNENEYNTFKKEFIQESSINPEEENEMPLSEEELKKLKEKAIEEYKAAEAAKAAEVAKVKEIAIEVGKTEAEKLYSEVEAKLKEKDTDLASIVETVKALQDELKASKEELLSMHNSKMLFVDSNKKDNVSSKEVDNAVLLSKLLSKPLEETKLGKQLIEKSDQSHQTTGTMGTKWEEEFSSRLQEDMELALIVEPLFSNIPMSTVTMNIPINLKAGYAQWIASASFNGDNSTGVAKAHKLSATSLTAHKLASKDVVSYEEEEDLIIPFLDVIRRATVERMANASDNALLVGVAATASPSNADFANNYPFDGLAELARNAGAIAAPSDAAVTADMLQSVRRLMGKYGLNPRECLYIVSQDTYYDLLEDPDFRTVDLVGNAATILRGEVGSVNGIRVIVSGEFSPVQVDGEARAICVNMRNYLKGTLRGLMVERDKNVEKQNNVIVVTRRFGMIELFNGSATESSVAVLEWATTAP